jgi:hypothetical protein
MMFGPLRRTAPAPLPPHLVMSAKERAVSAVEMLLNFGHKLRPGALEALEEFYALSHLAKDSAEPAPLARLLENYVLPEGIEMPWGVWVKP